MTKISNITCPRCGMVWNGSIDGTKYCKACRPFEAAEKAKKLNKAKAKTSTEMVHEITRLADAEGLSYGMYCIKYGI